MSLLVRAAEQARKQQQQKQQKSKTTKPIAERVLLILFNPGMEEEEKPNFKAFLRQAHKAGVPVYMYHPNVNWERAYKFLGLTPKERFNLVKGFFPHGDVDTIRKKINGIEKVGDRRIHHAQTLQQAQRKLVQ